MVCLLNCKNAFVCLSTHISMHQLFSLNCVQPTRTFNGLSTKCTNLYWSVRYWDCLFVRNLLFEFLSYVYLHFNRICNCYFPPFEFHSSKPDVIVKVIKAHFQRPNNYLELWMNTLKMLTQKRCNFSDFDSQTISCLSFFFSFSCSTFTFKRANHI